MAERRGSKGEDPRLLLRPPAPSPSSASDGERIEASAALLSAASRSSIRPHHTCGPFDATKGERRDHRSKTVRRWREEPRPALDDLGEVERHLYESAAAVAAAGQREYGGRGRRGSTRTVNLGRVVLLDVAQDLDIVDAGKIDGDALPAEPARAADPVEVVLAVDRQVVVDDERDLLDVDATRPDVSRDEDPAEGRGGGGTACRISTRVVERRLREFERTTSRRGTRP
jgi:hypothetical protein